MRFSGRQTVYACEEHEQVEVPIEALMRRGQLEIYPEVAGHGYFDINYRRGDLVLRASRYVGLIPLSDRVAIHVRPKVPIKNLIWMTWRSGGSAARLEGFVRGYDPQPGAVRTPEDLYLDIFVASLEQATKRGLIKRYESRESEREWRGALAVSRSVERFYSRGISYRHVFDITDLSIDNIPNRILKHTTLRLLRHVEDDKGGPGADLGRAVRSMLRRFEAVDETQVSPELVSRAVPAILRGLPPSQSHYEAPLWLSYLIATNSGISLERIGRARFESLIINVSDIFEEYVRRVLVEADATIGCKVLNGNTAPLDLFVHGRQFPVAPDYYFAKSERILGLADAKYKDHPSREDRYELLSHSEAAGVRRAAFICPMIPGARRTEAYGTTRGGIEVHLVRIDLGSEDLALEESRLVDSIRELVSDPA